MKVKHSADPDEALYTDLTEGSGEIAARELLRRIKMFICKKCPDFSRDADEIALDIFERVCERIESYRQESRFFTWVCSIAKNTLWERLREKGKEPLSEDFLRDLEAEYSDPEKILLARVTYEVKLQAVQEFLKTLPDRQREVFLLKHTAEATMTSEQLGRKLGISANAFRSALADANAALERWRKKNGY
jgi:RNA polymerase sigma factor (sigma-70 family)